MEIEHQSHPNLYLIGFMGVGKSVIGRRVAADLGYEFIDSDKAIERKERTTISSIFESRGEAAFRILEAEFVEDGHPKSRCVVSCGGGLVIPDGMIDLIKAKGAVICLTAAAETINERTQRNNGRPLLQVADPLQKIKSLLAEREPIYKQAHASISTDQRAISEVVRNLTRSYRKIAIDLFGESEAESSSGK